ncbi:hypothetical protein EON83_06400 [bacterium]|nr:MAG: hypothetical protein EON83_06400 [bacterium]
MTKFLLRFMGWWATISSLAALGGACPCCNSGVCPQGMAVWGILGAICACFMRSKTQPNLPDEPHFARHDFSFERPVNAPRQLQIQRYEQTKN